MIKIKNLILGGGATGLILGTLLKDSLIVDKNPLGQLNTPFIPGPRIFKHSDTVKHFIDKYTSQQNSSLNSIKIGYIDHLNNVVNLSEDFKESYSLITRNTKKVEKSFLSSGESNIDVISDGTEEFYNKVFIELHSTLKDQVKNDTVDIIDTSKKVVHLISGEIIEYENCYSTLNLNILLKLLGLNSDTFKLTTTPKHFVQCEYTNSEDIENSKTYHYMYSTNNLYTRKTYFKNYIVFELTQQAVNEYEKTGIDLQKDFLMSVCNSNFVLRKIFNLPFQIEQSINVKNIQDIHLVGRYAQWNHKIKANEVIEQFKHLI